MTLTHNFEIAALETTQSQFQTAMGYKVASPAPRSAIDVHAGYAAVGNLGSELRPQ